MPATPTIRECLREDVGHTVLTHRPAYTAQEEATERHVPGRDWAKVVVCVLDGEPIEVVLPR